MPLPRNLGAGIGAGQVQLELFLRVLAFEQNIKNNCCSSIADRLKPFLSYSAELEKAHR